MDHRKIALTLLMSLALTTGCSEAIEDRLAPDPNLQESDQNSSTSSTPNNTQKETNTTSVQLSEEIPDSIPIYSNAELINQEINSPTQSGTIELRSLETPNLVTEFYQQELSSDPWKIVTPFSPSSGETQKMTARSRSWELTVTVSETQNNRDSSRIVMGYQPVSQEEDNGENAFSITQATDTFSDLEKTPAPLETYVREVAKLGILTPVETENQKARENKLFAPNENVTRRTFARWLFRANNQFYRDRASQQIRPVPQASTPAFTDIPASDPDFPIIQGLAEAGIIPSRLTGDTSASRLRPDAPLTRESLLLWKVPLDTRSSLPSVQVTTIQETWGFQDAGKIDPKAMGAVVADFSNGERSNIRRLYGYTQLLQPEKAVTRAEAAASLWSFGTQGEAITAQELMQDN